MPQPSHGTLSAAKPFFPSETGYITDQYSQGPLTVQAVSAGATHTLEVTHDDPFQVGGPVNWFNHTDATTVATAGSYQATLINMPRSIRVTYIGGSTADVVISQLSTNG